MDFLVEFLAAVLCCRTSSYYDPDPIRQRLLDEEAAYGLYGGDIGVEGEAPEEKPEEARWEGDHPELQRKNDRRQVLGTRHEALGLAEHEGHSSRASERIRPQTQGISTARVA